DRRVEAWHYSDLAAVFDAQAAPVGAPGPAALDRAHAQLAALPRFADAARLVLVDGHFVASLSDAAPAGATLTPFDDALARTDAAGLCAPDGLGVGDAMVGYNSAFMQGGFLAEVAAGGTATIHVAHLATGAAGACVSRLAFRLGDGAGLDLVETFDGDRTQRHAASAFALEPRARASRVAFHAEAEGTVCVETVLADLAADSEFADFGFVADRAFTRRQPFVRQRGPRAKIALGGLSLLGGRAHADATLVVEHDSTHGESREFFRHVVADEATGVYQGKVIVKPGAQKTDGSMKSNAVLLSDGASMENKPELEIFADDVVCGHGATCGALDEAELFYLRARGIPRAVAEALMLEGFAAEALDRIAFAPARGEADRRLAAWLAARAA
ncbi:MAG: SufD family Fe-S cluster assembly protein, partial [Hyphomicrobiales bacterium]|nr:SufD family Fe-S cluster assembly protein [Hyphomicrobiales bacterium]